MAKLNSLTDLFQHEIRDLYSAELQLIEALPKMAEAASNSELRECLEETEQQKSRLEEVGKICEFDPKGETCQAMKGLIKEGEEIIKMKGENEVKDAGLIGAAQRIEHYEIAGYGVAVNYAHILGFDDVAKLLEQTLNEEKNADKLLNKVAVEKVNQGAKQVG